MNEILAIFGLIIYSSGIYFISRNIFHYNIILSFSFGIPLLFFIFDPFGNHFLPINPEFYLYLSVFLLIMAVPCVFSPQHSPTCANYKLQCSAPFIPILIISLTAFIFKLNQYYSWPEILDPNIFDKILKDNERKYINMQSGFSLLHYLGYYSLYLFGVDQTLQSRITSYVLIVLYLLSLLFLGVKVQFIIGLLILFYSYCLHGNWPRLVGLAVPLLTVCLAVIFYDNFRLTSASDQDIRLNLGLRNIGTYVVGSIINFGQYLGNNHYIDTGNLPLWQYLERFYSHFTNYPVDYAQIKKPSIIISENGNHTNTATMFINASVYGNLFFFFFCITLSTVSALIQHHSFKQNYISLVYVLMLTSFTMAFMGTIFKKEDILMLAAFGFFLEKVYLNRCQI